MHNYIYFIIRCIYLSKLKTCVHTSSSNPTPQESILNFHIFPPSLIVRNIAAVILHVCAYFSIPDVQPVSLALTFF